MYKIHGVTKPQIISFNAVTTDTYRLSGTAYRNEPHISENANSGYSGILHTASTCHYVYFMKATGFNHEPVQIQR
jgi:hypothetical protein